MGRQSGGHPARSVSLPVSVKARGGLCAECGVLFVTPSGRGRFCSPKCRYRARDRRRYEDDPDAIRAASRRWYALNRERKLSYVRERKAGG